MVKKRKVKGRRRSNLRGDMPGEYRIRDLVSIPIQALDADIETEGLVREDNWILVTRRHEGRWSVVVEHHGEIMRLPNGVVERIIKRTNAIKDLEAEDRKFIRSENQRDAMLERIDAGDIIPFERKAEG